MISSEKVLKYVEDGFVLNRMGEWVPMEQAVAEEEDLHAHVQLGRILVHGQWVEVAKAHDTDSGLERVAPADVLSAAPARPRGDYTVDLDTKAIALQALQRDAAQAAGADEMGMGLGGAPYGPDDMAREEEQMAFASLEEEVPEPPVRKPETVRLEVDLDGEEDVEPQTQREVPPLEDALDTWDRARGRQRLLVVVSAAGAALLLGVVLILRCLS
jgi:hypothetical protein